MTRLNRQEAERRGIRAETIAVWHLRLTLWRIVARRWRGHTGELDIVARRGRVLAVIEVKARADLATAAASIQPRQRTRIARAAAEFLAGRRDLDGLTIRFDAMLVVPGKWPVHLKDAW
jgi:putative endonuclease